MLDRFFMLGVNHRKSVLLFLTLVTGVAWMGLSRIQVDTGLHSLISQTDPDKAAYDRIIKEFGSDVPTMVYVRDLGLWTPEKLAVLERLHQALEGLDFVDHVQSLFTLTGMRGSGGTLDSRPLMPEAPQDQAAVDQARADALYNPLLVGNFISEDGSVTALMVYPRQGSGNDSFQHGANASLEKVLAPARSVFQEVFHVGPPRINAELRTVLLEDLARLAPLSAGTLAITVFLFLRSGLAAVAPLATAALSLLWTLGMMGWTGLPLNILSAMLPSLIVVIGSTEGIHLLASYFRNLSQGEGDRRSNALRFMMRHMGVPLLLTVGTTAVGFASNAFNGIGLIRDFALSSAFAVLSNGLILLLLLPMALSTVGSTRPPGPWREETVKGLPGVFFRLFGFSHQHFPRSLLLLAAVLCSFFLYQAQRLQVSNDPLSYFQGDRPLIRDIQRMHEDLSGMKIFYIALESETDKAFQDPQNIEKLASIQKFLDKQGVFDHSLSLADHLALVNREFNGGNPKYFQAPAKRDLVAQYLLFFPRRDLEGYVSHDFRRAVITIHHNISDSRILNRHIQELREVTENIAGVGMKAHIVGENLMINAASQNLVAGQFKSLAVLLGVIFLIMAVMFTSLKAGLVSLIPNLLPIILMFGGMALLGIPLNPGTAMVAVIAVGIAIDGTILIFSRYNERCARTSNYQRAVYDTVEEASTPLVAVNLALALGFGLLLLSRFTVIAQFGAMAASIILFALLSHILLTPLLMTRIRLVGLHQILGMTMDKEVLEQSPLFQGMTNYQIRKAILISELHEFGEGDLLVEQGTTGRSMYLILSGQVAVLRRAGNSVTRLALLGAGQVFGEIGYIREIQRTADVKALTPVRALRFDYERLKKDLKFFPFIVANLNFNISRILGERLADMMEGMEKAKTELEEERALD